MRWFSNAPGIYWHLKNVNESSWYLTRAGQLLPSRIWSLTDGWFWKLELFDHWVCLCLREEVAGDCQPRYWQRVGSYCPVPHPGAPLKMTHVNNQSTQVHGILPFRNKYYCKSCISPLSDSWDGKLCGLMNTLTNQELSFAFCNTSLINF